MGKYTRLVFGPLGLAGTDVVKRNKTGYALGPDAGVHFKNQAKFFWLFFFLRLWCPGWWWGGRGVF